ncbi:Small GTPase of the Rho/Rac subfamily of Ras-like proteins [Komagataella phaffii CBS 7435]|uniref:GTP-binding protein RHO3 n=2 Tax=Komagataella phaffii TaxID=460519 RepID=C4R0N5_KOMPG|nr:uncharacterized protein PAS_chr2-1_0840 [Komagataella phaffii GS115]AOA62718.1 GQ67_00477T0 [Komagataella phaffii]CAH2448422.1 Small GTPase of the Rho/Rac subfamily of Ras-like proteins [Komagataella phaffii CBS 7435]AOA67042.1 GQ68_00912T0 [Komagataella phaffii GS115]CAY69059.1 hypothetical protein PAS_chr2-1_0840 [Komagataella phaffii GS115]CCA38545.1 Small GTPase of the Rho/Rac subfamily of Ras-like proteins [Komagataella phaffii CBS 7435]
MVFCSGSHKPIQRKIVILGDGACGKTSLLNVFTRGYFPQVYEPTVFENYIHDIFIDRKQLQLSLWDTAGQEEFDRLRSLSYTDTDTIMLCFSIDSYDSLENVENKWVGEILEHCQGVKLVLVALKCDLRNTEDGDTQTQSGFPQQQDQDDSQQNQQLSQQNNLSSDNGGIQSSSKGRSLVTYEKGLAVAKRIGALRYLECSAMKGRGVNEVFTEAARCALSVKHEEDNKTSCTIM